VTVLVMPAGGTVVFKMKITTPEGSVVKPDEDTVVRALAWAPGTRENEDEAAYSAEAAYDPRDLRWRAVIDTGGWARGTWRLRADVSRRDVRGLAWGEIEIVSAP
jgi:hypothetical protein